MLTSAGPTTDINNSDPTGDVQHATWHILVLPRVILLTPFFGTCQYDEQAANGEWADEEE